VSTSDVPKLKFQKSFPWLQSCISLFSTRTEQSDSRFMLMYRAKLE